MHVFETYSDKNYRNYKLSSDLIYCGSKGVRAWDIWDSLSREITFPMTVVLEEGRMTERWDLD